LESYKNKSDYSTKEWREN